MTWHDTAFVFASFDTLLCLTEHGSLFICNKRKILMMCASWHTATVLIEISFVYRAKKACLCHHFYAENPVTKIICYGFILNATHTLDCLVNVNNNSPSQVYSHPDDQTTQTHPIIGTWKMMTRNFF